MFAVTLHLEAVQSRQHDRSREKGSEKGDWPARHDGHDAVALGEAVEQLGYTPGRLGRGGSRTMGASVPSKSVKTPAVAGWLEAVRRVTGVKGQGVGGTERAFCRSAPIITAGSSPIGPWRAPRGQPGRG